MNKETDNNYYCFVSKYLQLCEYIVKLKEFKKRRRTMKRLKKSVATVLAFVMVWSLMSLQSFGATITKSTTWNFTKWTAQTLTNDYSYDNLTVTATSAKTVSINSGINLGGGGAVDYRSIAFTATGPCTISVNAKGGSTTRYLVLANSNGAEYGRIATGSSYGTGTFNYTGVGENLYIYSAGSGITLSSMSLTYSTTAHKKGDVNNDGKVDKADAAIVLKHINGVSTITDADQLAAANYNNDGVVNALDAVAILNNQYVPEETTETTTEGVALDTVAGYEPSGVTPDGVAEVVYQSDTDDYLLKDTSTNCSATWKNSFDTISSGKVTITGYATPSKASSKWAFARVLGNDSDGNSVYFALGTDADKNISLCLSDGTNVSTDLAITANQKYTYEFVVDLDMGAVQLTVNGKTVTGSITAKSINAIYNVTAVSDNARNLTVSKPVVKLGSDVVITTTTETTTETTTTTTTETTTVNTADGVEVKDYSSLATALNTANAKIYVMNDIDCEDQIKLSKGEQSIIGVPDENGVLPVLNFENMVGKGTDIINASSSDGDVGLRITSKDNVVRNLVIEYAHDNGIQIKGSEVTGNEVKNCILRYNNDSGMQITGGAYNNAVENIYSYRNCDVYTLGSNADGFAVKLSAGPEEVTSASEFQNSKNTFVNCYSWENSDDGWDSFDYPSSKQNFNPNRWTYKNVYENCICWGNGSAPLQLGYTDYVNGKTLDENLPVIRRIKALVSSDVYNSFVNDYNNGNLGSRTMSSSTYLSTLDSKLSVSIPSSKGTLSITNYCSSSNWGGNPNGFKLGSAYTQSISERTLVNCISFDHTSAGFDKNNAKCNVELKNCLSFDNGYNYHLSGTTAKAFSNVLGWNYSKSDDLPTAGSGVAVKVSKPSNYSTIETNVRNASDELVSWAKNNTVNPSGIFSQIF